MSGLLSFHAHGDDETIQCALTLHRYATAGEHVVVITATDGAEGEIHNYDQPEQIRPQLTEVRAEEVRAALDVLGVEHHEYLGYRDSGMMGTDANRHPESFWSADFMEATARLVRAIRRHQPEVMTIYDPFGGYGHPDHINVHRVGIAAFFAATDLGRFPLADGEEPWQPQKLYWTAWPRSRVQAFARLRLEMGVIDEERYQEMVQSGIPDEEITAWIEAPENADLKEKALRAHRSQIPADWFMLTVPDEHKAQVMGVETFVRVHSRVDAPDREDDLFAGLR